MFYMTLITIFSIGDVIARQYFIWRFAMCKYEFILIYTYFIMKNKEQDVVFTNIFAP